MKLYKYAGPETAEKILGKAGRVSVRFSEPRYFNDPYELFLTIDYQSDPELLAFYEDLVGEITQFPVTCFSRRPDVLPMWASYADDSTGVVIEFEESGLAARFPDATFEDVVYRDDVDDRLTKMLDFAWNTRKFRHQAGLHASVVQAAYLTKTMDWRYERERRMILQDRAVFGDSAASAVVEVPGSSVTAVICGSRAGAATKKNLRDRAVGLGAASYEMVIGRSSPRPFFRDDSGNPYAFNGDSIGLAEHYCQTCQEPLVVDRDSCSWCRIDGTMQDEAAAGNSLRILDRLGLLEDYLADKPRVSRG